MHRGLLILENKTQPVSRLGFFVCKTFPLVSGIRKDVRFLLEPDNATGFLFSGHKAVRIYPSQHVY